MHSKPPKSNTVTRKGDTIFSKLYNGDKKPYSGEFSSQRLEAQVLNEVLDQVLTGKFYYQSDKMEKKIEQEELRYGKTTKYLNGMDYK